MKLGNRTIAILVPESAEERRTGLLTRSGLTDDEGMTFYSYPSEVTLHTFGMTFPIDILWLSPVGDIITVTENVPPGQFIAPESGWAIEVAGGWVNRNMRGT